VIKKVIVDDLSYADSCPHNVYESLVCLADCLGYLFFPVLTGGIGMSALPPKADLMVQLSNVGFSPESRHHAASY